MATAAKNPTGKKAPANWPKTLGECADMIYSMRAERLQAQKAIEELEEREKMLKQYIIDTLPKEVGSSAGGKLAKVELKQKQIPRITDDNAFYGYLARTKRWDLLQRRLSDSAVVELYDLGKPVPGTELMPVLNLSITKV